MSSLDDRWFLLGPRTGWRQVPELSDVALHDEGARLESIAPPPPLPDSRCLAMECGELAAIDAGRRTVVFAAPNGQVLRIVDPPVGGWEPDALAIAGPNRLWVVDRAAHAVHEVERCAGWVATHPGESGQALRLPASDCDPEPGAPFTAVGRLVLGPLDGGSERVIWHRVVLRACVPNGCRIAVRTMTAEVDYTAGELALAPTDAWTDPLRCTVDPSSAPWDCLVLAAPGRYLWCELTFEGDGANTPLVRDVEVHAPRNTSRRHLPAAMSAGPDGGDHLDRYLAITDRVRRTVTRHLDLMPAVLDPYASPAAPERDLLAWLSGWLGVEDADLLPERQRRRLLAEAASLYRVRGTPEGVRRHAELWLGRPVHLLEHYRLRRWAVLHGGARLGDTSRLFGEGVMRRVHLDEFSELGSTRLIDPPGPPSDPFALYAHRFTLVVRSRRTDNLEELADRAAHIVSLIAPAHTRADVAVAQAALQVGCQATLGVDAVVAGAPDPAPLGSARLRHGLVVAADPHRRNDGLGHRTRISHSTVR